MTPIKTTIKGHRMDLKRSDFLRWNIPPKYKKPAEIIHAGLEGHRRSPFQKEGVTVSGGAQCPQSIAYKP
jgi:hypothetical protein